MSTADYIQLFIGLVTLAGFAVTVIVLKRDNRKSNEETITKTIENKVHEVQELMQLRSRVDLLEQRVDLKNNEMLNETRELKKEFNEIKKDFSDIKQLITALLERFSNHLDKHKDI